MELLFVARVGDQFGEIALRELSRLGHTTKLLGESQSAPAGSIALFTPSIPIFQGSRGRFMRLSARKLVALGLVPEWAKTPFVAAILRVEDRYGSQGFLESLRVLALEYSRWDPEEQLVPWAKYEEDPKISMDSECMKETISWRKRLSGITIIVKRSKEVAPKDYQTLPVNSWSVNVSSVEQVFPDTAVEQGLNLLSRWQSAFVRENTWSRRELGTPSLVVRLDCVVHKGLLTVYEVEERPSGMGVSSMANPFFQDRLSQVLKTWPDFRVVVSSERSGTDDYIWMNKLNRPINQNADLVLVRAEPEETAFHHLEAQSVSSLISKGDKGYGVDLGLWRKVSSTDDLPWNQGFVLKPRQGSKMHDVEIWDPQGRPGSAARSRIVNAMTKHKTMFLQDMVDPMLTGDSRFTWMIYRVFFGYNTVTKSWECLGGNWNARSNLRIHGASDALFGPLVLR